MEFDIKLEDWINRCLIQTYHRLSQEFFKSYRIAFRMALWLDFEQLSSYLFVYRRLFRAAISKCYMEFDTKLEDWIKRYLIQTYHRLSQEYFKSYRIAFRVALWLDFEQLSSYLFIYRRIFGVAVWLRLRLRQVYSTEKDTGTISGLHNFHEYTANHKSLTHKWL